MNILAFCILAPWPLLLFLREDINNKKSWENFQKKDKYIQIEKLNNSDLANTFAGVYGVIGTCASIIVGLVGAFCVVIADADLDSIFHRNNLHILTVMHIFLALCASLASVNHIVRAAAAIPASITSNQSLVSQMFIGRTSFRACGLLKMAIFELLLCFGSFFLLST